jgi:hypothetical protein
MTTESAKKRPDTEPQPSPKRSGTRLVVDHPHWPARLDQDLIPTQPESESPVASSELPTLAPPDDDEMRDTLPAPPPIED